MNYSIVCHAIICYIKLYYNSQGHHREDRDRPGSGEPEGRHQAPACSHKNNSHDNDNGDNNTNNNHDHVNHDNDKVVMFPSPLPQGWSALSSQRCVIVAKENNK